MITFTVTELEDPSYEVLIRNVHRISAIWQFQYINTLAWKNPHGAMYLMCISLRLITNVWVGDIFL